MKAFILTVCLVFALLPSKAAAGITVNATPTAFTLFTAGSAGNCDGINNKCSGTDPIVFVPGGSGTNNPQHDMVPGYTYRVSFQYTGWTTSGRFTITVAGGHASKFTFSTPLPSNQATGTSYNNGGTWNTYTTTFTVSTAGSYQFYFQTNSNYTMYANLRISGVPTSTDATLSALTLSSGALSPTFASGTIAYTQSVPNSVSTITVTPTVNDANATVTVNGTAVATGVASGNINLNVGANTITTVVTAQNGTTKSYTTTVTREAASSTDANLSGLAYSSGALTPAFASGTIAYTHSVPNSVSSITVMPTVSQANATVTVNGAAVASGVASGNINLNVGANTITTVVTAQDGSTTKTYTTTVTRAASQSLLTVNASPSALNASTTTSTLSTSGGSGTGAVSYAMTAGTCTLSGNTVTAGSATETCTVTATKAADSTYESATATVDITVSLRATLASAANDASVIRTQATQLMQSQAFTQSQVQNITNHLDGVRHNFNLMPSHFGIRLHAPSLDPIKPLIYKVKDVWLGPSGSSSSPNVHRVVARHDAPTGVGGALDGESLADAFEQQSANADQSPVLERGAQRYSWWSAGTVDTGLFRTGANHDEDSRFRLDGLTFGVDYKAGPRSIVGLALGLGYGTDTDRERLGKVKSSQKSLTGYGVMGFGDGWVVDGLLGYGSQTFSGDRTTSDGLATLSFRRPGDSVFMSGSVRKVFEFQPWRMAVFLRDDVTKIRLHRYVESGAADYALGYQSVGSTSTNVSAGLNISKDMDLDGGKLTTTAIFGVNRWYSNARSQGVFYADAGVAGGVHALNQPFNDQTFQSLSLGVVYVNKSGDGFDLSWMKSVGSRRDKLTRLRFGVNFAF